MITAKGTNETRKYKTLTQAKTAAKRWAVECLTTVTVSVDGNEMGFFTESGEFVATKACKTGCKCDSCYDANY